MLKKQFPPAVLLFLCVILPNITFGQEDDKTLFQKYFAECNANRSADVPKEVSADSKRAKYWLNSMESSLSSKGKSAICATDGILDIARYDKENKSVGRIAVNLLTKKLELGGLNDYIIDRLDDLPSNFFLDNHKQRIHALAQKKETPHRERMIDLLTMLNYEPGYGLAAQEMENPNLPKSKLFKYHTLFAKRGYEPSIAWLQEQIKGRKVDQQALYGVVPQLLSTRQKPLVQWVVNGLYETEALCSSSDDRKGHCGVLILEQLAPVIKDFPIKADDSGLIADDDAKALETAREWFKNNPDYKMVE
jgi:hypothetical protein